MAGKYLSKKDQDKIRKDIRAELKHSKVLLQSDPPRAYSVLSSSIQSFKRNYENINLKEAKSILDEIDKLYHSIKIRNEPGFTKNPISQEERWKISDEITYASERMVQRCLKESEENPNQSRKDIGYAIEIMERRADQMEPNHATKYLDSIESKAHKDQKTDDIRKRIKKSRGLEGHINAIISITSLSIGIFFLSPRITGNAIGFSTNYSLNFLSPIFLMIGLITGYFWLKMR
jgi:hypothetical protein